MRRALRGSTAQGRFSGYFACGVLGFGSTLSHHRASLGGPWSSLSMAAASTPPHFDLVENTRKSSSTFLETTKRSLCTEFAQAGVQPPFLRRKRSVLVKRPKREDAAGCALAVKRTGESQWRSLGVDPSELCLALTLTTGQSFRWKVTGESQYTGVVDHCLVSLRQTENDIEYLLHNSPPDADDVIVLLSDYFNLGKSLKDVWESFMTADERFASLAPYMAGARLLRQPPIECAFQFICSSNNHIQRITQMVDYLASLGPYLGTVQGIPFHAFPSLDIMAWATEMQLREAGFGYRAKYIVGAVKELQAKEGGGERWLLSLRHGSLNEVLKELSALPGIGPKVAACIALFSLDQHHAIPVDTHVWQIATTYITPELSGERLTPKLHTAVSDAFVKKFGKYAGWAQNVLFIAELSSHQVFLPEHLRTTREKKVKEPRKRWVRNE